MPNIAVSYSRKVNLGNYESADFFVAVSDLEPGATADEISEILDTAEVAFPLIRAKVEQRIREKVSGGEETEPW